MKSHNPKDQLPDPENPERRAFTLQSVMAILSGVAITVVGCGDDDSPTGPSQGDVNGNVSANHGHSAVITSAQLTTPSAVTLQLRGGSHLHTVELTSQEIAQVAARAQVTKTSSTDDSPDAGRHSHTVTFN